MMWLYCKMLWSRPKSSSRGVMSYRRISGLVHFFMTPLMYMYSWCLPLAAGG